MNQPNTVGTIDTLRAIGFVMNGAGIGIGVCAISVNPVAGCIAVAFSAFALLANFLGMARKARSA